MTQPDALAAADLRSAPLRRVHAPAGLQERLALIGVDPRDPESLPFAPDDATGGSESELQAAVAGTRHDVDLPRMIEVSNYFANAERRAAVGDMPRKTLSRLESWLDGDGERVWDHSWVRVPASILSPYARFVFEQDLRSDTGEPGSPRRGDADRFMLREDGEEIYRLPISYLLKLSLADALGTAAEAPEAIKRTGRRLMAHFLSDNTSPETFSFHVVELNRADGCGRALARETAKRFLFSQLLTAYANSAWGLEETGQRALVYASPHPPIRQRQLNDCISDSFYRELFMNPCLSGWRHGEEKRDYMSLCHQTLSRSQLNAVGKLREAGIITRNLVILPNTSSIALANNGSHVSLGSKRLTAALRSDDKTFRAEDEKQAGDLAIKIVEHFLPLFVGAYSAAPYRIDFKDFHPEKALGFLPHQLDFTHLRMLWRRWRGKARTKVLGQSLCPLGPDLVDRALAATFRLQGDFVPDFRLLDYLVAPLSTQRSPALDGTLGNEQRLLRDLDNLGVFDARMAMYFLFRLRDFQSKGYSGFEGRHYSLFSSTADMEYAVNMQMLLSALAFRYIVEGAVRHQHIPDKPQIESERRQIVFGTAIGIPTFFVREDSGNTFLLRILSRTRKTRMSSRYPGRIRVYNREYQLALLDLIEEDAADLIEAYGMRETLRDLRCRIEDPKACSAAGKLTREVVQRSGANSPFSMRADEFNMAAEDYYRDGLRRQHMSEALEFLEQDVAAMGLGRTDDETAEGLRSVFREGISTAYFARIEDDLLADRLPPAEIRRLIHLMLLNEHHQFRQNV